MRHLFTLFLILFSVSLLFGQAHCSAGVQASYRNPIRTWSPDEVSAAGVQLNAKEQGGEALGIGAFATLDFQGRFSASAALSYVHITYHAAAGYTIKQEKNYTGAVGSLDNFLDLKVQAAYEILPGIKPFAGISVWYFLKEKPAAPTETDLSDYPREVWDYIAELDQEQRIIYSINQYEHSALLSCFAGLEVEFGRLSAQASYQWGLTPLSNYVDIEGQRYDFRRRMLGQASITLAYIILQ